MKKNFLLMGILALGLGFTTASCSDDDNELTEEKAQNLE